MPASIVGEDVLIVNCPSSRHSCILYLEEIAITGPAPALSTFESVHDELNRKFRICCLFYSDFRIVRKVNLGEPEGKLTLSCLDTPSFIISFVSSVALNAGIKRPGGFTAYSFDDRIWIEPRKLRFLCNPRYNVRFVPNERLYLCWV